MPARQAGELEILMGIGCLCHLAQTKVETFREQNVQQPNFVGAWYTGSQVGEGIGEACGLINFEQYVSDAHIRKAAVEIEDELIGLSRYIR